MLLEQFLRENIGRIVTSSEFREAAGGVSEWAPRVRGLRDEEGWSILTHHDSSDLVQGQYRLSQAPTERPRLSFGRAISAKVRAQVLDRNGFTCQMCGLTPGEIDPSTGQDEQRVVFQWLRKKVRFRRLVPTTATHSPPPHL